MFFGKIIAVFLILKAARLALLLPPSIFNVGTEIHVVMWDENADRCGKGKMEGVRPFEIGAHISSLLL